MKNLFDYYKRVNDWNAKAGVKDHEFDTIDWWKAVELQTKLLVEESEEARDGALFGDKKELLDGAIDSAVILFKLLDMLDKAGYDVDSGFEAVLNNNDAKVFDSYYLAVQEKEKLEDRDDVEYTIETSVHEGLPFYSIRRLDGKIMKKVDFVAVELDAFVP